MPNGTERFAVVVGGANVDLLGVSDSGLINADSNPGRISESPGGVGRNIAENLVMLGVPTVLITAFGDDAHGRWLREECMADGIDIAGSVVVKDIPGSRYLAISKCDGDMALALNDMRALTAITPDVLAASVDLIARAGVVVADTNIPAETLRWLAKNCASPWIVDPVSAAKAPRMLGLLGGVYALKLNALEASALLGRHVAADDDADVSDAAAALVALGVKRVFLTRGTAGVIAADRNTVTSLPAPDVSIANVTGAGDAFSAGVAYATLLGATLGQAALIGSGMAALALKSERTVSRAVDPEAFAHVIEEL